MKKLMIAAAAAAMIGGAQAATATYTFRAWLTTTDGQNDEWEVSEEYISQNVTLGRDVAGNMWYQDNTPNPDRAPSGTYFKYAKSADGKYTATWSKALGYDAAELFPGLEWNNEGKFPKLQVKEGTKYLTDFEHKFLQDLQKKYGLPSEGQWCCEFSYYTHKDGSDGTACYRVVGYDELVDVVMLNDANCCAAAADRKFVNTNEVDGATIAFGNADATTHYLLNRFGSRKIADANDVEIFANVKNFASEKRGIFYGYLAGQGYVEKMIPENGTDADAKVLPRDIYGKIVGHLDAAPCMDCCTPITDLPRAFAFDCLLETVTEDATLKTAAFGDFSLSIDTYVK